MVELEGPGENICVETRICKDLRERLDRQATGGCPTLEAGERELCAKFARKH